MAKMFAFCVADNTENGEQKYNVGWQGLHLDANDASPCFAESLSPLHRPGKGAKRIEHRESFGEDPAAIGRGFREAKFKHIS